MLKSALDHYERQQRITAAALVAARRKSWRNAAAVAEVVAVFQVLAAEDSAGSIGPMLDEQDLPDEPLAQVVPRSVAGTASDGRSLVGLMEQATSPESLGLMVVTQIQDAARAIGGMGVAVRPRMGFTRMLNTPSCSRCVILAGKYFKWNDGFQRHPRCDCRHIPTRENLSGDLRTDPRGYFDSLSPAEQAKTFGKANAEAIRLGADVSQVVNVYRRSAGMQFAGVSPIKVVNGVKFTTEGTTVRGIAGQQQKALRKNGPQQMRLMPESILMRAKDQDDAVRLLRLYGYVRDIDATALGRAAFQAEAPARKAARRTARRAARAS